MNDRDRLAADLHELYGCRAGCRSQRVADRQYENTHDTTAYLPDADRLIDLGWTRRVESVRDAAERLGIPTTDHGLPPDVVRPAPFRDDAPDIDEGRLARALTTIPVPASYDEWLDATQRSYYEDASAIAKAYREDTDAR